jgi:enoyl-CoA hydratase/carnithine racemase
LAAAVETAHDIAANTAPLSVAFSKQLLWDSWGRTPVEIERLETDAHHHLMGRPDAREGVMAFLERRPPEWQGSVSKEWPPGWPGGR